MFNKKISNYQYVIHLNNYYLFCFESDFKNIFF
jgi:hypothetical protein